MKKNPEVENYIHQKQISNKTAMNAWLLLFMATILIIIFTRTSYSKNMAGIDKLQKANTAIASQKNSVKLKANN